MYIYTYTCLYVYIYIYTLNIHKPICAHDLFDTIEFHIQQTYKRNISIAIYIYIHQDLHDRSLLFQVFPTARLLWRNRALHWWTTTSWRTSRGPCGRTGAGGICSWSKTWVATPFECMATWPAMLSAGTATKPFVVLFFGHGESYHFWVWLLWLWWLWLWWLWWLFKAPQTRTRSRSHVFCL